MPVELSGQLKIYQGVPEKANWFQQPHDEEGTQSQEQLLDHRFPFCLFPIAQ